MFRLLTGLIQVNLRLLVRREGSRDPVELVLTPKTGWGGRGSLGYVADDKGTRLTY